MRSVKIIKTYCFNYLLLLNIIIGLVLANRCRGLVVMDFDCYTGDRSSIPTHGDSLGKWMNLRPGKPMPCEGNCVVSPRCWRDIDLHSVYNCENGLLSILQFNHIEIEIVHLGWCYADNVAASKKFCQVYLVYHLSFDSL